MKLPPELSIPEEDWERTPRSVQVVLLALWQENLMLKQQIAELRAELEKLSERVNKNYAQLFQTALLGCTAKPQIS